MKTIAELETYLTQKKAERALLIQQRKAKADELEALKAQSENLSKARWILAEIAKETQTAFQTKVESLVTSAIRAVFEERAFEFKLVFEQKRNKFECKPIVVEGENEYEPKDELGGGIIDLISFAFRVVLWHLENPRSRNVFVLDEPMKFVGKGDLLMRAGRMIKEISHRLGFQIIMVTHEPELAEIADKAWVVEHDGTQSNVRLIVGNKPETKVRRLVKRD
jgi:DNA repair exonuclease SbcCD ATPase subunit